MPASQPALSHPPATSSQGVSGAVRRAAAVLQHIHHEQTLMWELCRQANRAAVPSSGPLTWVLTLDGYRLAGCHLPASDHDSAERAR